MNMTSSPGLVRAASVTAIAANAPFVKKTSSGSKGTPIEARSEEATIFRPGSSLVL